MSPLELKEERDRAIAEFNSLKILFGSLLLEDKDVVLNENKGKKPLTNDLDYMSRKYKESVMHKR